SNQLGHLNRDRVNVKTDESPAPNRCFAGGCPRAHERVDNDVPGARQLLYYVSDGFVRLLAPILVETVYASVPVRGSRLFNGDRRFTKRESLLHATSLLSQYYTNSRLTD